MGPVDIAVLVVVCAAFIAVMGVVIYKKVKHKGGGCDCGCEGCPHCGHCGTKKK